jgi:nitrate/nitrite-specific signal transduction histidine kinase
MTILRRMQIAAVVLLLSAVGGILLLFWNSRQVGLGIKEIDTTAQIANSAFLLRILMGEFLNGGNKKSLEQWAKQNQRLGQLLNNETLAASTDPDLLRQIRKSYDSVKNLYPHVIEMRTSTENESGDLPAEKLLNSLILLQLEQLVNGANDLSKATQSLTIERRNFVQQLIVTLGILAVVIILIYIYQIRRSVVNPLTALSTTAERIGEGNYDFIPDTKSDDEVGKLAQSFNTMVQRLRERSAALKEAHDKLVVSVEERTTALHTVRAQNEVLQAVQRSQTQFISEKSSKEFFGSLLHDLLTLTNSEFGFIGEVLYSEDGRMYLRDRAITDVSWDEETRDRYQRFSRDKGPDFYNVRGLWGTVIQTGEPVISNDPANDPS